MDPQVQSDRRGVTFKVHDVAPATKPLEECKSYEALGNLLNDPRKLDSCSDYHENVVDTCHYHSLLAATHLAFSQHRPLILSPDIVWLCIQQGFAHHVVLHAEELRDRFVPHQGKARLEVVRLDFVKGSPENPWPEAFAEFSEKIRKYVGDETHRMLLADFSTTGPVEKAVSEVVMMDAFQAYFDYVILCICGIPEITLEGTTEDWTRLRAKSERLGSFGLEWWMAHLIPICDHFVRASQSDVDTRHWGDIYKLSDEYGAQLINGWMAKLIPYVKDWETGQITRMNPLLTEPPPPVITKSKNKSRLEQLREKFGRTPIPAPAPTLPEPKVGLRSTELPSGLSIVPFIWADGMGKTIPMEFIAGYAGITQDPVTLGLRPKLGWAVRDAELLDLIFEELRAKHRLHTKNTEGKNPETFWNSEGSAEMQKFYDYCDGADLFPGNSGAAYRILPLRLSLRIDYPLEPSGAFAGSTAWKKVCLLPDGTCIATKSLGVVRQINGQPQFEWIFIHTDFEKSHQARSCPIVARSFSELLKRMLEGGPRPYWQDSSFESLGMIEFEDQ